MIMAFSFFSKTDYSFENSFGYLSLESPERYDITSEHYIQAVRIIDTKLTGDSILKVVWH